MNIIPAGANIFRRVLLGCLITALLVSACERPATRSSWSPINDAEGTAVAETLPQELPVESETTPAQTSNPVVATDMIGTLDVSQLPQEFPHSMKGYELFSWQVEGEWYFTLTTGTNRIKSFDEIITPGNSVSEDGFVKVSARGIDQLQLMLGMLPTGEDVIWSGMDLGGQVPTDTIYLTLPPQDMIDEVTAICNTLGIHLKAIKPQ